MIIKKTHIILLLSILLPLSTFAQRSLSGATGNKFKYKKSNSKKPANYINSYKATLFLGGSSYYGDLCSSQDCVKKQNLAIGLGGQYRWTRHVATRVEFLYAKLSAKDSDGAHPTRNLSFRSHNIDASATFIYDPFPYNKMFLRRHSFAPYGFAGFGATYFNPQGELDGEWYSLRDVKTENVSYSSFAFNIPFGVGLRYKAGPQLDISTEFGYRWTFTDYLDDVSNQYPDSYDSELQENLADKSLSPQAVRGNPKKNDGYFIFGFRAEYTIKVPRQHYNLHSKNAKLRSHRSLRRR